MLVGGADGVLVEGAAGGSPDGTTGGGVLLGDCGLLGVAGVGMGGGEDFGVGVLVDGTTG